MCFLLLSFVLAFQEPIIGGPCEGCNWVFSGMPHQIPPDARIAPEDEPGEKLIVEGTVLDSVQEPVAGIVVYAYHTDTTGIYPRAETRHGRLRGWAKTDANGHYQFTTIRPGAYPDSSIPQHIHMHIIEPGKATYYIDDIHFTDDPKLQKSRSKWPNRGGSGVCTPQFVEGTWYVERNIQLGLNIPGYP